MEPGESAQWTVWDSNSRSWDRPTATGPLTACARAQADSETDSTASSYVMTGPDLRGDFIVEDAQAGTVHLNGTALAAHDSQTTLDTASSGWFNAGANRIRAKSDAMDVYTAAKTFTFSLTPVTPRTSVSFVCDRGITVPGDSIYVVGSIPAIALARDDWEIETMNVGFKHLLFLLPLSFVLPCLTQAADEVYGTTEPFASEAVYFVLTDRFVDGDASNKHENQGHTAPRCDSCTVKRSIKAIATTTGPTISRQPATGRSSNGSHASPISASSRSLSREVYRRTSPSTGIRPPSTGCTSTKASIRRRWCC